MHTTSLSLIVRLKQRVPEAWERFDELYSPLLHHWARLIGLSAEEVQDAVQDVSVLLWDKLQEFNYDGRSFRGWLRTILQNKGRDMQRRRALAPQPAGSVILREARAEEQKDVLSEEEFATFLARQALQLMQSEFQEATWRACWLTTVDGLSAKAAAEQLGITENAVFLAKGRVLRRLREEFSDLLE